MRRFGAVAGRESLGQAIELAYFLGGQASQRQRGEVSASWPGADNSLWSRLRGGLGQVAFDAAISGADQCELANWPECFGGQDDPGGAPGRNTRK